MTTIDTLLGLLRLEFNWDSYGALTVSPRAVCAALRFLARELPAGAPLPSFVPTVDGGIQLEWHVGGIDIELRFTEDSERVYAFYEHAVIGFEWESESEWIYSPRLGDALRSLVTAS